MKKQTRQKGFTIIEAMIGIALGITLVAGIIQVVLASKQSYSTQQAVARVQENGRMAVEYISREARNAGYMGCMTGNDIESGVNYINLLNDSSDFSYDFGTVVQGYDNVTGNIGGVTPVAGTDALVLRVPAGSGLTVSATHSSDANVGINSVGTTVGGCPDGTDSFSSLCNGDILMLSNCSRVVVFQATNVQGLGSGIDNVVHSAGGADPGNTISSWNSHSGIGNINPGEELIKLQTAFYYIGLSTRTGRPGLFQKIGTASEVELVEDVQSMSITYGVDSSGDDGVPEVYSAANAITAANWANVVAIRIQLLIQTPETNILPTAQANLSFNGSTVDTSDRRLRQIFSTTIALRNRLP